jgi:16S rRNA (guanine966-N2)-methyltransferase
MRVIAGEARGFPLKAPKSADTRPTSDKIRGAIYSMLASMGVEPERVLDLYAGSGALGIEALSRGAESADLVERNAGACAVIRENLAKTKLAPKARVLHGEVERMLSRLDGSYDLILLDPPYADQRVPAVIEALAQHGLVTAASTVVYEHSKRTVPPLSCGPLALHATRCHGDTCITIYD